MKKKITLSYVLSQFALLFLAVLVIYPLFFVLMTSVKSNFDVLTSPFAIHSFKPQNYIEAWKIGKIGKYFMNSVFITAVTLLVQMVVIVLASYSFGKLQPWGHNILLIMYMTGLFVTSEMITVPNFMTMKALGLTGSRLSLLFPYVTNGIVQSFLTFLDKISSALRAVDADPSSSPGDTHLLFTVWTAVNMVLSALLKAEFPFFPPFRYIKLPS